MFYKNIILFFVAAVLVCGCTKVKEEYYPDGTMRSRIEYRHGLENGVATFYEPNGARSSEVVMKDGKKEGAFRTFYYSGNLESEATYHDDLLDGRQAFYATDGTLTEEVMYVKGKKNGDYRVWHARDLIQTIGHFKNDLWNGRWEYYDGRGFLVGEGDFNEGTGTVVNYNSVGNKYKTTHYVNNMKDGDEAYFDENGNILKILTFKEDRIIAVDGCPVQRDSIQD